MPIVYDGTEGSSHGDLFRGLKLFISFRVPQRERWVSLVKGNGGEVVLLERQADMLIADHVKRNGALPPPGSYSWKWIQYSVRNGFLQPRDDYRIETAPARAAGASAPTSGQRSKFTKEDDDILANFVWEKERQGSKIKGNVIFQELDEKYPNRHTPQSWRDRWVKYVSNRPRQNVPQEKPPSDVRAPASTGGDSRPIDQPPRSQAGPSNVQPTPASSPGSTPGKQAQGRIRFTSEDDEALLKMIRDIYETAAAKGEPVRGLDGNKIFEDFAAENKRHPAHSWRNRWVRHLKATFEQKLLEIPDEEGEGEESPAEPPRPQTRGSREIAASRLQAKGTVASPSAAVSLPTHSTPQRPRPGSDDDRLKRQEERKRRARAAMLLQRTWRGHIVRRDRAQLESSIVPLQSLVRGYLLRMREAERLHYAVEGNAEPLEVDQDEDAEQYEDAQEDLNSEVDRNDSSLRDQFYEDLRDYIDVSGAEIELRPIIRGRELELWDLFSAATRQDCVAEDRDWKQVAQRLGFDCTSRSGCVKELKECYDHNLAEFEEAIGSYDDGDGTAMVQDEQMSHDEEHALVQTSDAVTAPKQPSAAPLSPTYRSSSPIAAVKRSFQQSNDPQSEFGYPSDRSSKRRRRDRETAIPQTPEHELGFAGDSRNRARVQDFASPLKSGGATTQPKGVFSTDDADAFLDDGIHGIQEIDQLPDPAPTGKRRFIEPETQDFGLAMSCEDDVRQSIERDGIGYMTDEDDVSPSQQLRSEFDAFSSPVRPVPFRGNGAVSVNRPSVMEPKPRLPAAPANDIDTLISGTGTSGGSAGHAARSSASSFKATKRSLPHQYRTQQAVPAAAHPPASVPRRSGIAALRLQPRSPVVSRPAGVYSTRSSDDVNLQSMQKLSANSTRAVQLSAQQQHSTRRTNAFSPLVADPARAKGSDDGPDFGKEYVDAQFEHFTALGYEARHIGQAMEVTSLQRGPMTVALQSLAEGKGIPQNAEGVWTDDDDEKLRKVREYDRRQKTGVAPCLPGENAREKAQVERYRSFLLEKHKKWVAHRSLFMNMMDRGAPA